MMITRTKIQLLCQHCGNILIEDDDKGIICLACGRPHDELGRLLIPEFGGKVKYERKTVNTRY